MDLQQQILDVLLEIEYIEKRVSNLESDLVSETNWLFRRFVQSPPNAHISLDYYTIATKRLQETSGVLNRHKGVFVLLMEKERSGDLTGPLEHLLTRLFEDISRTDLSTAECMAISSRVSEFDEFRTGVVSKLCSN